MAKLNSNPERSDKRLLIPCEYMLQAGTALQFKKYMWMIVSNKSLYEKHWLVRANFSTCQRALLYASTDWAVV